MTRILFLTESFYPVLGGGERHIRDLGRGLVAAGDAVSVVTRRGEAGWPAEETLDGMRVLRVPPPGPARSGKYRMALPAARRVWRERASAELVVVRGTRVLGLPGLLAARLAGRPVVLQPELNGEMSGEIYLWGTRFAGGAVERGVRVATWLRNRLLLDADAFVAMSQQIEAELLEAGAPRERVHRIPHGVDCERFHPASAAERAASRRRFGFGSDAVVIAWTGRLLRGKGLETLLDAFEVLLARYPAARLLLAGDAAGQSLSVEAALRERAGREPLSGRVSLPGRLDAPEQALFAADLFAFPSEFEALGLSLIEAGACGLPAVASRTGGIVDVVAEGETGLLCEPGDAAELATALSALLDSPERRAAMGARARARVLAEFDAGQALERYRCLFGELTRAVARRAERVAGAGP